MRDSSIRLKWLARAVVLATFATAPLGCGGEPTGDDAYSQKFEAPAGAPADPGAVPDPYSERDAEIKKAQSEPPKGSSKAKNR